VLITWAVSLVAVRSYNPDQAFYDFLALEMRAMFAIEMVFLAIGLLLGCAMKQYKRSASTAVAIILATYFMSMVSSMQESLDFLEILHAISLFRGGRAVPLGSDGQHVSADLVGDYRCKRCSGILDIQQARSIYLEKIYSYNPAPRVGRDCFEELDVLRVI
jgi:hypothetical protein